MTKKKNINDTDKFNTRSNEVKTVRKIVSIIILSLILIFVVGGISGYMYVKSALSPVEPNSEEEIEVNIPLGSSTSTIASILEKNGIIKDARIFRFYTKFKNMSDFQAGEYTFTPSLTIDEIIESLKSGKVVEDPIYAITIPEGKTIDQIAGIYASKLPFSKEEFLEQVNDIDYINQLMESESYSNILSEDILNPDIRTPLEGYLFAATYNFYEEDPTIESVIEKMLSKTVEVTKSYQEEIDNDDFNIHQLFTFTSLVENEAKTEEQRKKIAGVLLNRLDEGMKLQTDPTVLYALGGHKEKVLLKDLETESPYNTYYIESLPVGPISNFSTISLEASTHSEQSDNLYYLHDEDGNIYYSETHEEHVELKKQHIK